jgi:hypothetical protein
MVLTRDFRETVQARVRRDAAFRKGLLRDAIESLLAGEVALGKELLRDYINATVGFPKLAADTELHVKTAPDVWPKGKSNRQQPVWNRCLSSAAGRCPLAGSHQPGSGLGASPPEQRKPGRGIRLF